MCGGGGDPFQDMFNHFGFGGGGGRRDDGEKRTDSIQIPLTMNLKQLYNGVMLDLQYVRDVLCTNWEECVRKDQGCSGPGIKIVRQQIAPGFVQQVEQAAPQCVSPEKPGDRIVKHVPTGKRRQKKSI
jgi:DnaJ-class molecular chaperone